MAESIDPEITAHVSDLAVAARHASRQLALLSRSGKDAALRAMADALEALLFGAAGGLDRGGLLLAGGAAIAYGAVFAWRARKDATPPAEAAALVVTVAQPGPEPATGTG